MRRTGIDPQVAELHASQRSTRHHPLDRLLYDPLGKLSFKNRTRGALLDAADVPGVVAVDLVLPFLAGEHDLFGVHDDDVVPAVDVRRIGRFVLAAQAHRDNACKPSDDETGSVDQHPLFLDLSRFGRKGLHGAARPFTIGGSGCLIHPHPGLVNAEPYSSSIISIIYSYGSIIPLPSGGLNRWMLRGPLAPLRHRRRW